MRFSYEFIRPPDRHYRFEAELLAATDEHIILEMPLEPSKPLSIRGEVVMAGGYDAVWFLFQGQPWDIARVYQPDGTWTGCYIDVLEPVRWEGADPATLQPIVDLFLDVWIEPDGSYLVLDEDEFSEAVAHGSISDDQARQARTVLASLRSEIEAGRFLPPLVREYRR